MAGTSSTFENALPLHKAFFEGSCMERPFLCTNVSLSGNMRYPLTLGALPEGEIISDDLRTALFIEDCERLYSIKPEVPDDFPFIPDIPYRIKEKSRRVSIMLV